MAIPFREAVAPASRPILVGAQSSLKVVSPDLLPEPVQTVRGLLPSRSELVIRFWKPEDAAACCEGARCHHTEVAGGLVMCVLVDRTGFDFEALARSLSQSPPVVPVCE